MAKADCQEFLKEVWHYRMCGTRGKGLLGSPEKNRKQIIQVRYEDRGFKREKTWGDEATCNLMFGNSRQ